MSYGIIVRITIRLNPESSFKGASHASACSRFASSGLRRKNQNRCPITSQGLKLILTHHQPLDVFDFQMVDRLPEQYYPQGGPSQKDESESCWNQPIQRRKPVRTSKNDMEWRSIHDEHAQAGTSKNPSKIPFIGNSTPSKGES